MKNRWIKITSITICIACIYVMFFFSIKMNAFSPSFYEKMNQQYEISDSMGITDKEYQKSMITLLDYIKGERSDIVVYVEYNNKLQEMFNEREKEHMVDVQVLYMRAQGVAIVSVIIAILGCLFLFFKARDDMLEAISTHFIRVSVVFVILLAFLAMYALIDFESFWWNFHTTFFSNDLWLLNPSVDRMIQMLPQDVFFALVFRIVLTFVVLYGICLATSITYLKVYKKKRMIDVFM